MTTRKHEEIADNLIRDILVGQYRRGERLPSERDLAARFDANRGAVREAMKKLEQLGLAAIGPGGARVAPLHEASLDVIGYMMELGDVPDANLVDQILQVMGSLVSVAAESAINRASDEQIEGIRARVQVLTRPPSDRAAMVQARVEVMTALMEASGNLVCRLITRALLAQFAPRMIALEPTEALDGEAQREHAQRLDEALRDRDVVAVRETFAAISRLNRESARRAFAAVERRGPGREEVVPT